MTPRKPQGPRITAQRYDAIVAALRATPDDVDGIAERFDLGRGVVARLRGAARIQGR